jgi:hypothetical protein
MMLWSQLTSENKTLPIFPIALFPPISYLARLSSFEAVALEGYETFPKQTYRNRAYILSANGLLHLTVPVKRSKQCKQLTQEVRISYQENWNLKCWRAIFSAYGKSPYFEFFAQEIESFFTKRYDLLVDLNLDVLMFCKRQFSIRTELFKTSEFKKESSCNDFRESFQVKNQSQELISMSEYYQCFSDKFGFVQNLSCLDLLFNLGKESISYLQSIDFR